MFCRCRHDDAVFALSSSKASSRGSLCSLGVFSDRAYPASSNVLGGATASSRWASRSLEALFALALAHVSTEQPTGEVGGASEQSVQVREVSVGNMELGTNRELLELCNR